MMRLALDGQDHRRTHGREAGCSPFTWSSITADGDCAVLQIDGEIDA